MASNLLFLNGIAISFVVYPFDTLSTRYQVKSCRGNYFKSIYNIYKQEGLRALYNGFIYKTAGVTSYLMIFQLTDSLIKRYSDDLAKWKRTIVDMVVTTTLTNPVFVIMNRKQTANKQKEVKLFQKIMMLYKGVGFSYIKNFDIFVALTLTDIFDSTGMNHGVSLILSKILASGIFYPAETLRSNIRNNIGYINIFDVCKKIRYNFYNGLPLYLIYSSLRFVFVYYWFS
jgi:hypothetical protein